MENSIPIQRMIISSTNVNFAIQNLSRPDRIDWPDSWSELSALRQDIKIRLKDETYQPMMDLSLAAHFLMTSPGSRDRSSVLKFVEALDPDLLPKDIFDGNRRWVLMSILAVSEHKDAFIHPFIIGNRSANR